MSKNNIGQKYRSSTHYILSGLIPYTEANMKLAFKPGKFFDDLERLDSIKSDKKSIKANYYRLVRTGFIKLGSKGEPTLTRKAQKRLKVNQPKKLGSNKKILVAFDVPETKRDKRDSLRLLLRSLSFKQVQLSVWETDYDYTKYLKAEIPKYGLSQYVSIYESEKINL